MSDALERNALDLSIDSGIADEEDAAIESQKNHGREAFPTRGFVAAPKGRC
jgi:hypothetical protein